MSMLAVPSVAGGAKSLPAELRTDQHEPRGNAWGHRRLHNNQTLAPSLGYAQTVCDPFGGNCQVYDQPMPGLDYGYPPQSTGIDWGSIIGDSTHSIAEILAITQGGGVTASGNIYGNPAAATVAAGTPASTLNIGSGGVSGNLSSIGLLIGAGLLAIMLLKK